MPNPFAGPRPIARSEPIFGRNREIQELRQLLISERLVLLHSPSGAGKTSLINAGLLPELDDLFEICPPVRVDFPMPFAYRGAPARPCSATIGATPQPGESIADIGFSEFAASLDNGKNNLIIFDHFEQTVRTTIGNFSWHAEFFRQLGVLLSNPTNWALFSLREDYLAPLLPILDFLPTRLRTRYRLDFLAHPQAQQVMLRTAETENRRFTEKALTRLCNNLATVLVQQADGSIEGAGVIGETIEPLQLQVVCRRLWDAMPETDLVVDPEDVETFGNVAAALGTYYHDCVDRVAASDPLTTRSIRDWFQSKLITPAGIRSQVQLDRIRTGGLENTIIESLLETHLVRAEVRRGFTWYELAHDSLINPVLTDNATWYEQNLSPFQHRAAIWLTNSRIDWYLLNAAELSAARAWADIPSNAVLLTTGEREFLDLSQQNQTSIARETALRERLSASLVRLQLERAFTAIRAGKPSSALAHLAYALRVQPDSRVVRCLTFDLLQRTSAWLPFLQLPATPLAVSPDASLILTGAGLFNATGDPVDAIANGISTAVFSPDSRYLVTANDGPGTLWDLSVSPRAATPLDNFSSARFSPDGLRLLTWNEDHSTLWDTATATRIGPVLPPSLGAAFSADSARLLTWSPTGNAAQVWDAATAEPLAPPLQHDEPVLAAAFSPDGLRIRTATANTFTQLWDAATAQPAAQPLRSPSPSVAALFSAEGRIVGTANAAGTAQCWDTATGAPLGAPMPHDEPPSLLAFSPGARALVTVTNRAACVWDTSSGQPIGHPCPSVLPLAESFILDHPHLLPAAAHGLNGLLCTGLYLRRQLTDPQPGGLCDWSSDGRWLAVANADTVHLWDASTGERAPLLALGPVSRIAFSPDSQRLLIHSAAITVYALSGDQTYLLPEAGIAEWSADGRFLLTVSDGNRTHLWDAPTGNPVNRSLLHARPLQSVSFSASGPYLLTTTGEPNVSLWNLETHTPPEWFGPGGDVSIACFAPDGLLCLTARANRIVLWSRTNLSVQRGIINLPKPVVSASFSPNGHTILTTFPDHTARLWATKTGSPIGNTLTHSSPITHARFSPDSAFLLTITADAVAQLWDASTGLPIAQPHLQCTAAAFSPDSATLLTVSPSAPARLWALNVPEEPSRNTEILPRFAELYGGETLNEQDALVPFGPSHQVLFAILSNPEGIERDLIHPPD